MDEIRPVCAKTNATLDKKVAEAESEGFHRDGQVYKKKKGNGVLLCQGMAKPSDWTPPIGLGTKR